MGVYMFVPGVPVPGHATDRGYRLHGQEKSCARPCTSHLRYSARMGRIPSALSPGFPVVVTRRVGGGRCPCGTAAALELADRGGVRNLGLDLEERPLRTVARIVPCWSWTHVLTAVPLIPTNYGLPRPIFE